MVTTAARAAELGLTPFLRIVTSASAGVPPRTMGIGPVPAVATALQRAELEWAEDLYRQNPSWPVIDVTRKAVEETAAIIIKIMNDRGLARELAGAVREAGQL